jgi:hypothetical protein
MRNHAQFWSDRIRKSAAFAGAALVLLGAASSAQAADYFVRPALKKAYGTGTGLGYANAWSGLGGVRWRSATKGGVGPGDTLWVCGTHRGTLVVGASGSQGLPITIRGDFAGDPGVLLGSRTQGKSSDWTSLGNGLWATVTASFPRAGSRAPGWVLLGPEAQQNLSVLRDTLAAADRDGLGWWDESQWRVILRSSLGNPATIYGAIEIPYSYDGVHIAGRTNVALRSLAVRYTLAPGVTVSSSSKVAIESLDVRYVGGGRGTDGGRAGDGIQIDGNSSFVTVDSCTVSKCFDIGVAPQLFGTTPEQMHDIAVTRCTVDRCGGGVAVAAHTGAPSELWAVDVSGNTITNSGYGWSGAASSVQGLGIHVKQAPGSPGPSVHDVRLRDNVIDTFAWAGILAWKGNFLVTGNIVRNGTLDRDSDPARASGILIHGGEFSTAAASGEATGVVAYNLVARNAGHGVLVLNNTPALPSGLEICNNVLVGNGDANHSSFRSIASNRTVFNGNIVESADSVCSDVSPFAGGGVASDFNSFYRPAGALWRYAGRTYELADFAAYEAASGQDADSIARFYSIDEARPPRETGIEFPATYVLSTAAPTTHGAIQPSGTTVVASGGSLAYAITPDPGYAVSDVRVNGTSVGAVSAYVFPPLTADSTIEAAFAPSAPR